MELWQAALLGVVEGLTEFVPVSSTGHLILAGEALGLGDDAASKAAVDAFDIVIQAGAWLAAVLYYRPLLHDHLRGLGSGDLARQGRALRLLLHLGVATLPVVVVGLLARKAIKHWLFGAAPVAIALAVGGVAMIVVERWLQRRARPATAATLDDMTMPQALQVGAFQCLALVPGTSRSMATMLGGMIAGMSPRVAADFSFLLAIPVLGAATLYELVREWRVLVDGLGPAAIAVGLVASFALGWASIAVFLRVVVARGLWPFGAYRVAVAAAVWWVLVRGGGA